ncbi:MAG TPA: glycosyltransferase family 2 protein [Sedimentisphaerales bacterium]|jgi:glycosyltransferase involved in cell wall biosynthesis|nr:glycosyltransferase family 2 protein [Sedimentisphaerales bacterium]HNU27710.1 glycosyltransferase family 2 protein [Sedimentisphaerales bacterium]
MRVSIVTVCFNSAATIEDTIQSVCDQEYDDLEHIIVDGGSTDGTQDVIRRHNGRIKKFISEPDRGIYDAMNKGLALAAGEVVAFLNADDVYASSAVIGDVTAAIREDHVDGVYGDLVYVKRQGSHRILRYWRAGEYRPMAFYRGWVPPHPTFFCQTAVYRRLGGYDPVYRIAGDFELMLRFIEKNRIRVQYVPRPLVRMRMGGQANTVRGMIQGNREIVRAFRSNDLEFPTRFFCSKLVHKVRQLVTRPEVSGCVSPQHGCIRRHEDPKAGDTSGPS